MTMAYIFPIERPVQKAVITVSVLFSLIPITAVALRVLARRISNRNLDISDYLMIAACVISVSYQGIVLAAVLAGGMGFHTEEIIAMGRSESLVLLNKIVLAVQVLWSISLGLTKGSILILYTKVFQIQSFVVISRVTAVLVLLWALVLIVGPFAICQPLEYNWNPTVPGGHCGNQKVLWYITGVFNIVTDLVILLLPMPYLYGLELAFYKKLALMCTFGIGLLVCIVSAIRLVTLVHIDLADFPYTGPVAVMFSALEPCLLITAACVPLMRPLLGHRYSPTGTAKLGATNSTGPQKKDPGFKKLNNDPYEKHLRPELVRHDTMVASAHKFENRGVNAWELESISVRKDWRVEDEPTM